MPKQQQHARPTQPRSPQGLSSFHTYLLKYSNTHTQPTSSISKNDRDNLVGTDQFVLEYKMVASRETGTQKTIGKTVETSRESAQESELWAFYVPSPHLGVFTHSCRLLYTNHLQRLKTSIACLLLSVMGTYSAPLLASIARLGHGVRTIARRSLARATTVASYALSYTTHALPVDSVTPSTRLLGGAIETASPRPLRTDYVGLECKTLCSYELTRIVNPLLETESIFVRTGMRCGKLTSRNSGPFLRTC